MVERWKQPVACSSGRNGATVNLFVAASAAAWPQQAADGVPGVPPQLPQLPPAAHSPQRQQAPESRINPQVHPRNIPPPAPVPRSQTQGNIAQAARPTPARQQRSAREVGQGAAGGLTQQSDSQEVEVIDVSDAEGRGDAPADSESSLDSWGDHAAALAERGRNRLKRKAPAQLIIEDDEEESLSEQPPQSRPRASAADEPGRAQEMGEMQGALTSLSQLADLDEEDYPATVRVHGSIVGMVSITCMQHFL